MKVIFRHSTVLFLLVTVCCVVGNLQAQYYFGKNKVQYTDFDWYMMTTEHFNVYYYSDEAELAEIAAESAERSYKALAAKFNHEIYSKIPLIIYSTPNHFVQTNVTFSFLPENVAGFTEFIKGRVVVPFNGSYFDFDRVIRHEMVHVFTISRINRHGRESGRFSAAYPPLWFTEGLAEYWSREWGSEADLIVRDMVINGTLPKIDELWTVHGTFFMYKLGQSICEFIAMEYGEDKLTRMFDNWYVGKRFEEIVKFTLGEDLKTVSDKWQYHLKKKYYPQIEELDLPDKQADRLTEHVFAVRPVPVQVMNSQGEEEPWVIYKANKTGYSAIYMQPADKLNAKPITLLKGERSSRYESLHLLSSGVDQYNDSLLVFASKSKERDVLYIYDLTKREVVRRYEFDSLIAVTSPRFSPNGDFVAFTGNHPNGYADLFVLELATGGLRQITDDIYNDLDPSFGHDGKSLLFASDRGGAGYDGYTSIYRIDLESKQITRLTSGTYTDRYPSENPLGSQIVFTSDRGDERAVNIFMLEDNQTLSQVTAYITGAFDPRFSADGSELYFYGYQNRGFHLFRSDIKDIRSVPAEPPAYTDAQWFPGKIGSESTVSNVKYKTDYSLDIAQSTIAYDGVFGTLGGIQAAMSDVLGNNTFVFLLSNTAREKDDLLTSFNVGVTYLRRTKRVNLGIGGFHLYDEYYNDYDGYYYERLIGGMFLVSYPFSKFTRVETSVFARHSDKDTYAGLVNRKAFPATHLVSFVTDNTLWLPTGPIDGRRLNLTAGYSYDFRNGRSFNRLASADLRIYQRLRTYSCIASRFFAFTSAGIEPQRLYLGGSWSFRGYNRRHWYNRNILFNSVEIRFPLINALILATPPGVMRFGGIQGAIFHDLGTAWDDRWDGWHGSFGLSFRLALGYLVTLRLDISRTHDFHYIASRNRTDFFFGWNF
ncbi:MAG: hypothetical protein R3F48_09350 [Candidatus Zixiibacteriota bacterium]